LLLFFDQKKLEINKIFYWVFKRVDTRYISKEYSSFAAQG